MKHLGDITKINGAEVEPVEVIIGGSPCQDLSVAGERAGLEGARSGLFMEQIRIIKEMRENDRANGRTDDAIRPKYMVFENVPGLFSSNKGEDFRIVLEKTAKIADPEISIPRPPQGKWTNAGAIVGNGFSIAWRVLDAQFFGVPQRRRRIALVADFGGQSAPEILFERKSLSRNIEQSGTERERTAGDAERCVDEAGRAISFQERAGCAGGVKASLSSTTEQEHSVPSTINWCYPINTMVADRSLEEKRTTFGVGEHDDPQFTLLGAHEHAVCYGINGDIAETLDASYYKGCGERQGAERTVVYDARENGSGDLAPTITGDHQNRVTDYTALCIGNGQMCNMSMKPIANSLDTMHDQQAVITAVDLFSAKESDINGTLQARCSNNLNSNNVCRVKNVVRRLTPLECERLQGYPDLWCDIGDWTDTKGKKHKAADSPRYKALGNSIAIPCWRFILQAISDRCTERTMASLFDGIGGFPLIWEQINGSKSCRWVSEIEEFPIAVTKIRFEQE